MLQRQGLSHELWETCLLRWIRLAHISWRPDALCPITWSCFGSIKPNCCGEGQGERYRSITPCQYTRRSPSTSNKYSRGTRVRQSCCGSWHFSIQMLSLRKLLLEGPLNSDQC